jgi:hypothetical protein
VKEAQRSVLDPHASKSAYKNHGERVVAGQRLIQRCTRYFLGWGELDGIHFYVRQLRDMKGGAEMTNRHPKTFLCIVHCAGLGIGLMPKVVIPLYLRLYREKGKSWKMHS